MLVEARPRRKEITSAKDGKVWQDGDYDGGSRATSECPKAEIPGKD